MEARAGGEAERVHVVRIPSRLKGRRTSRWWEVITVNPDSSPKEWNCPPNSAAGRRWQIAEES